MSTNSPQVTVQKKGLTLRDLTPYLYIVPSLALFITFVFYPFAKTIYLSLHVTDPTGNAIAWAGTSNYAAALADKNLWTAIGVTIKYAVMVVAGSIVLGTICAILSNEAFKGRAIVRTVYAMPMAIS